MASTKPAGDGVTVPEALATRTPHRARDAVLGALALACFVGATPASGQTSPAEPTADRPTYDRPLADPHRALAVELAMRIEDGVVVCRPDRIRLPVGQELSLQLVNETERPLAFAAPDFFAERRVANLTDAAPGSTDGVFVVPARTIGRIVLTTDGTEREYAFGCALLGDDLPLTGVMAVSEQ